MSMHQSKAVAVKEFPFGTFLELKPNTTVKDYSKRSYLCSMDSKNKCCSCTDECANYGSCCIDKFWTAFQQNCSLFANADNSNMLKLYLEYFFNKMQQEKDGYECTELVPLNFRQKPATKNRRVSPTMNYYMIRKCNGPLKTKYKTDVLFCEEPNPDNFFNFIPVQDTDSAIYRNSACARCNGAHDYHLLPIEAQCGYTSNISMNALSACEFALRDKQKKHKCAKLTHKKSECSNQILKRKCSLYQGLFGVYRNYHCYKCIEGKQNLAKISRLRHGCRSGSAPIFWSMLIEYSQKLIFKRGGDDGEIMKTENKCPSEEQHVFSNQCYNKSDLLEFEFRRNFSRSLNLTKVTRTAAKEHTQYHLANQYIFFTGSTLSIISYSVTLFTYGYFKELQNVHGYNILSMCSCLLAADALILLANATSCYVIGVLLHYVMLAGQIWVAIICFDIAISFHSALTNLNDKKQDRTKLFWKYLSVAFVSPLLVVIPALTLSKVGVVGVEYVDSCRPKSLLALLLLYVLPIGGLNLLSLCVLIKTFMKIYKDKEETGKTLQSNHNQANVFKMACKLMVGLGVIECIGFIQINEGTSIFDHVSSVVYNIVRSFRGVFVFAVFVVNEKVVKLYRNRFAGSFQKIGSASANE